MSETQNVQEHEEHAGEHHEELGFWQKYVFSTDHKWIGIQYAVTGLAAKDDVTTVNQLYLPVDKPVLIYLSSKDVIHSFALPEMRVKQDAIPGLRFPVWFKPTVTTAEMRQTKGKDDFNYEIACAQLCGNGHSRMRGFYTILPQEEYDAWMAEQQSELSEEDGDDFWG